MATLIADSDVVGGRFVSQSTSTQNTGHNSAAGEKIFGVSHLGTRTAPYPGLDANVLASSGEEFAVYTHTDVAINPTGAVMLEAGGTIAIGDSLKATTDGKALTTTTPDDWVGAIAAQAGIAGNLIQVRLISPTRY